MKRIMVVVMVLVLGFFAAPRANSQGFVMGLFTGALLFGDGSQAGSGGASVMYTMARASERVKDPLQMKQIAMSIGLYVADSFVSGADTGLSLKEEFENAIGFFNEDAKRRKKTNLKGTDSYEIIQVVRLFNERGQIASLLFTFIEKGQVIPLDQLPKK
jgi:hypothetical protein